MVRSTDMLHVASPAILSWTSVADWRIAKGTQQLVHKFRPFAKAVCVGFLASENMSWRSQIQVHRVLIISHFSFKEPGCVGVPSGKLTWL